ncbi:IS5 family transposase [Salisediminibacterium selenitireducens]|uniref:Transposase IS4 family protein n=1 Tax=Bacillus selenitireducens (strain ATCC 700615 / DSM 15326 / MLS10) TaxID=439292 RepID=D6XZ84_BACIE|nr:transposase IS4 family protein [[Bacillus] selenitireducens MLS10]
MHQGKLLIDATCAPSDIAFPTDLTLLNRSREKLETMIDTMHEERLKPAIKPRTYRKKARKQYLSVSKQKRPGKKKVCRAMKQQLNHVKRDLNHIAKLAEEVGLSVLSRQEYRDLLVIQELYRQQLAMYQSKQNRIDNRIVSIEQPHVRPIVRGKAHTSVEFGAKMSVVMKDGWTFLDRLEWDSYHEGHDLQRAVMTYRDRYGCFPEAVLADRIYATRENRRFCKENGIRLSGPRLGRPPKHESVEDKQVAYQDACERNAIEAKFGEGKRSYGLGLIRARLKETSETVIALQILNLNLSKVLRDLPSFFIFILGARIRDYFTDLQSTNNDEWVIQ